MWMRSSSRKYFVDTGADQFLKWERRISEPSIQGKWLPGKIHSPVLHVQCQLGPSRFSMRSARPKQPRSESLSSLSVYTNGVTTAIPCASTISTNYISKIKPKCPATSENLRSYSHLFNYWLSTGTCSSKFAWVSNTFSHMVETCDHHSLAHRPKTSGKQISQILGLAQEIHRALRSNNKGSNSCGPWFSVINHRYSTKAKWLLIEIFNESRCGLAFDADMAVFWIHPIPDDTDYYVSRYPHP